ncbi:MAG: hypothetical protein Q7T33_07995 [Dehalococcoidia bacterium]|nr:hypothetical protein [Dehalococcoidia bacterium]
MRPNALEALRGVQAALMESIVPELSTMYAQDVSQVLQMLIESLAGEWDSAADDLVRDNRRLVELLSQARGALQPLAASNGDIGPLVQQLDETLAAKADDSLRLSSLTARNNALRGALEQVLVRIEDATGRPGTEALTPVRKALYDHLRQVSVRGWSFWDMASFREKMAALRAGGAA